jgi:hypothetical protein
MILSQFGLDKSDERVRNACEYICQFFNSRKEDSPRLEEEGARMKYLWMKKKKLKHTRAMC